MKTTAQLRQSVGALMNAAGAMRYKQDVLAAYGAERIRDLNDEQLLHLEERLRVMAASRNNPPAALRKLRSTVLALCDDLGIKPRASEWTRVNQFLLNPRVAGKLLYEMTEDELKACAKRLRAMLRKRESSTDIIENQAKNN